MAQRKLYPIGIQTFSKLREEDRVYVDKTQYVYDLAHGSDTYVFLSRPRRFGKSLFLSTLKSYFEGRRDLFQGLAIERLETEWEQYPVLHFSMASGKHMEKKQLEEYLADQLAHAEEPYGIANPSQSANVRLKNLILTAYKQTKKKVVILIDEYDAPLLDVVHEERELPVLRDVMRNFYSPLKDCDPYIRFAFLTGITKFSQLSIFSELNNITNISMNPRYAAICGITREELTTQMGEGIDYLASCLGMTHDEALKELTLMYDGYHFAWPPPDIFNPYSILRSLANGEIESYWFGSGTPTYLIEMMRRFRVHPSQLSKCKAVAGDFDAPTHRMTTLTPLLYQSGYFTIKAFNKKFGRYTLDIPNKEVRIGLMGSLIPYYITPDTLSTNNAIVDMAERLDENDMDGALKVLQAFLSTVPYCDNTHYEGHWQQVLYIIFSLIGNYADVEVHTATGRVDLVMATESRLYLVETNLDKSAEAAMAQIDLDDYADRFARYPHPIVKVAINFDSKRHTLQDWKIG